MAFRLEKILNSKDPVNPVELENLLKNIFAQSGLNARLFHLKTVYGTRSGFPPALEFMLNFSYCTRKFNPEDLPAFIEKIKRLQQQLKDQQIPDNSQKLTFIEFGKVIDFSSLEIPAALADQCVLLKKLKEAQTLSKDIIDLMGFDFSVVNDGAFCVEDNHRCYALSQNQPSRLLKPVPLRYNTHSSLKFTESNGDQNWASEAHLVLAGHFQNLQLKKKWRLLPICM